MKDKLGGYDEHQELLAVFDSIVKDSLPAELADSGSEWFETLLKYNTTNGGLFVGRMTISCYRHFRNSACDEEEVRLAYILAWCVELLEACFLVADDIMDNSETRRKRPCWYRLDSRGLHAFHDALLLEQCAYMLLRKHFKGKACYARLYELFHRVCLQSYYGQAIDTHEGNIKNDPEMEGYTVQANRTLVKYKGVVNYFYLPWACAVAMAGLDESDMLEESWSILTAGGELVQGLNDFLDVFGDVRMTGKIGTDIVEGKLTWVIGHALQACTPQQRQIIKENYGRSDPEKVAACKRVFEELDVPKIFKTFEREYIEECEAKLERIRASLGAAFRDMFKELKRSGLGYGVV